MGYLPEAMRNYLDPGSTAGAMVTTKRSSSDDQAIAWFEVADVVKAPARLDWDKLGFVNNHYLRAGR